MGKTDRQAIGAIALAVALVAACKSSTGHDASRIAYRPGDDCVRHTDSDSCTADGCQWYDVDVACGGTDPCPSGICVAPDPCVEHTDEASCVADSACAWAPTDEYCPPGAECGGGGFCYARGDDDCACVCPAWCLPGEDGECAPCECDCDGGGGGECPWVCPACAPGEECPPCTQDCGGTCTWICPDCGPDVDFCAPCYQECEPGCGGGEPPCACVCPACVPGEECPPCDCTCGDTPVPAPGDPTDPVPEGDGDGDDPIDCTCACPDCAPGTECGPCECDCGGGGSCGGDPGPSEPPVPGDPGEPRPS